MNVKKMYLSGPIDNCTYDQITSWREYVKRKWIQFTYLDPVDLKEETFSTCSPETIEKEKSYIRESDIFLCYPWKPGSGTAMEVMYAHELKNRHTINVHPKIVTVSHSKDYLSPWIRYHSDHVAETFNDAFEWVESHFDRFGAE